MEKQEVFSQFKFSQLWKTDKWREIRRYLVKCFKDKSDDHWVLLHIAETYYQENQFEKALDYAERAFDLSPHCPLATWEYAEILDRIGRHEEAALLYQKLIRKGVKRIAYGSCGEGIGWARIIINDSYYALGVIHAGKGEFHLAEKYIKKYIFNRKNKYESHFNLREVKKDLIKILQKENPRDY